MEKLVTYAEALQALKDGKRVRRKGWNGAGLFAFKQVHVDIPIGIVPTMQSLPQAVKDEFIRRKSVVEAGSMTSYPPELLNTIRYRNQFCIVYPDNTVFAWVPSANDTCNDDWIILK